MRRPPPLSTFFIFPITTSVIVMAVIACWRSWGGANIEPFMPGSEDWWREPWRFVTPVLFHGDPMHLIFNVVMFWVFGTCLEMQFGPGRTLAVFLLFSVGTIAAEHALHHNAIGLSGVVYGQFGLLWVLSARDSRFRDAVDKQTVQWMVGWFFLCIALTIAKVWQVANVAHGVGCLLGVLLGWAISAHAAWRRVGSGLALAAFVLFFVLGATVWRPWVNSFSDPGHEFAYRGYRALVAKDAQRAVPMLEHAVADNPNVAGWWQNLGIAYQMLDRTEDAVRAFQRAAELDPKEPKYKVMMWRARLQGAAVKATAPDEDDQDASP